MNFSKTTAYALTALNYMAGNEMEVISAMMLHKKLGIPWPYLRKILNNLVKRGLITSRRGRQGGFLLAKKADAIFIAEIIDAVEGLDTLSNCIMGFEKCPFDHKCALHGLWEDTRKNILDVMNNTSLGYFKSKKQRTTN